MSRNKYTAIERSVALMGALGFIINSITATGTEIKPRNMSGTTVTGNGGVYDIETTNKNGNNAFNHFEKFELSPNNIANMYFGTKQDNSADNLFNFVNSQIKVDGTVNAIKNNKIGGNLYFLSSSGMVVGNTGVINTGALYVITPTETEYNAALGKAKEREVYSKIIPDSNGRVSIPLNPEGTITVRGEINAVDEIGLYAAKVEVGNVGTLSAEEGTYRDKINLRTGVMDFGELVNVDGIDSGLDTRKLTADKTEDGDIILVAKANKIKPKASVEGVFWENSATEINAKIEVNGKIESAGDIDMEAYASNGAKDKADIPEPENPAPEDKKDPKFNGAYAMANVKSEIIVKENSQINSAKDITMSSKAENIYESSALDHIGKDLPLEILGMGSGVNMDVARYELNSSSKIEIGKDAQINSGGKLKLDSYSEAGMTGGAETTFFQAKDFINGKIGVGLPSSAVAVAESNSTSQIVVDGDLNSKSDTTINSKSKNTLRVSTSAGTINAENQPIVAGVLVANGENTSAIKINGDVKSEEGRVEIKSMGENSLRTEASAKAADKGGIVTAINVTTYNSSSNIDINGEVTGGKDITISSENKMVDNEVITNNSVGTSRFMNKIMFQNEDFNKFTGAVKGGIKKLFNMDPNDDPPASKFDLSNYFGLGATVSVVQEKNSSSINIGKGAKITSNNGNINITSTANIEDLHLVSTGKTYATREEESKKLASTAAVTYGDFKNSSDIVISGDVLGNGIKVESQVKMEYRRIQKMIAELKTAVEILKDYNLSENHKKALENFNSDLEKIDGLEAGGATNLGESVVSKIIEGTQLVSDVMSSFGEETFGDLADVIKGAADFAVINNYTNIYSTTSGSASSDTNAITGNVSWTEIDSSSNVVLNKGAKITAKNGNIDISSKNIAEVIGAAGNLTMVSADANNNSATAIGGSFVMQQFDSSSKVVVGEGAELEAEGTGENTGNINITSDSEIYNTIVSAGAGKGGNGITGMVNYSKGESDNRVSIDNDVLISATKALKISAENNTNVTNVAGAFSMASQKVGIGIGVAINDYSVKNNALIQDNDTLLEEMLKDGVNEEQEGKESKITGSSLDISTKTEGQINAVGIAGGAMLNDESGAPGFFTPVEKLYNSAVDKIADGVGKVSGYFTNKIDGGKSPVDNALNTGGNTSQNGRNNSSGASAPSLSLTLVGSVSVNNLDNETKSIIDGANIEITDGDIKIATTDESFTGAWSGEGALQWQNAKTRAVGIGGAVGLNIIKNSTEAVLQNSAVDGADSIDVQSDSRGSQVAAGLAGGISKNSSDQGSQTQGQISASINDIEHNITAKMSKNIVNKNSSKKTDLSVTAEEEDVQVTGGVSFNAGIANNAIGATVTVANLNNKITAEIDGGEYNNIGDINVNSLLGVTQVTAAASMGVTTDNGNPALGGLNGAVVYNGTDNIVEAGIKNAHIDSDGNIKVTAGDVPPEEGAKEKAPNKYDKYLTTRGIDTTGEEYYSGLDVSALNADYTKEIQDEAQTKGDTGLENSKKGATIVSAGAMVGAQVGDSPAMGAAVVIDQINNRYNATIDSSTITANSVDVETKADTFLVGVAGGVTASKGKFGAMGSVSWQEITNELNSSISNSTIKANSVKATSDNDIFEINVGGQIAYGNKAGIGAVLANSDIENTTKSSITGGTIDSSKITVEADSSSEIYTIGAGVAASKEGTALQGTVALNMVENTTEAIIGDSEKETLLKNIKNIDVIGNNNNQIKNIVVGITGSKSAAIGGAVAYSEIDSSVNGGIFNGKISVANGDEKEVIKSSAKDESDILTVAVAAGGADKAAVEGAAATAIVDKDVTSKVENTHINEGGEKIGDLEVTAENLGKIISNASVIAGSGKAGVGAGVAVNQITQNTDALLKNGVQNLSNALLKGSSKGDITTIGIGGSVGGAAGVIGSVAVNQLENNTKVNLADNTLNVGGSVGVLAQSDDIISNYAGTLAGASKASVGASVSVNEISGDTLASIKNSEISADGNGNKVTTNSKIENKDIIDSVIDKESAQLGNNLVDKREKEEVEGIVVDSSSTHTVKSLLATVTVAGIAGINGTVNVNQIDGSTGAKVSGSNLTSAKNIDVSAKDYTNSSGIVGALGAGSKAGVGASSDTNIINRDTNVNIASSQLIGKDIDIDALSKQGVSSFGVGAGGTIEGGGVAGTVTVTDIKGDTSVIVQGGSEILGENIDIGADHYGAISAGTGAGGFAAIGGGVGAAVSVIKDENHTIIDISDTEITSNKNINIQANNLSKVTPTVVAVGLAGAGVGVAGTVSVNNMTNVVAVNISDSTIISENGNITITSKNKFENDLNASGVGVSAFAGVGAVVNVNTVDSAVATNISGTDIVANNGDIKVTAEEERDIDQLVTNAAGGQMGGLGANVLVNNFGKGEEIKDFSLDSYYKQVDAVTGSPKFDKITGDILKENSVSDDFNVTADKGGSNPKPDSTGKTYDTGVNINIAGSNLNGKNINIESKEVNKISSKSVGAAGGMASASGTVAITNFNRNMGIDISNSEMEASEKLNITANTTGDIELEVYQGTAGLATIGAAYGEINSFGKSLINLSDSQLTSKNTIDITNKDNLTMNSKASGLAGGMIAAGAIVSEVENKGIVQIDLAGTSIEGVSENSEEKTEIKIEATKENSVVSEAFAGSVGILSGIGTSAIAKDNGVSGINIKALNGKLSSISGSSIDINAINNMGVKAKTGSVATGFVGAVGVSVAEAETDGKALINSDGGAEIAGENITVEANIGTLEGKDYTLYADTDSITGGIEGGADVNRAKVVNNSSAEVILKNIKIDSADEINIFGRNNTKLKADIDSVAWGGVFASGTNSAEMVNNGKVTVDFSNNGDRTEVDNLSIEGTLSSENTLSSNGYGGAGMFAEGAAIIKNSVNTKADVIFGGDWKVGELLDVKVSDNIKVSLTADSTRGGYIGANGIFIENKIANLTPTKVKITDGTEISGDGAVNVDSRNDIDVDINAEGAAYGAVGNSNVVIKNSIDKKTEIELGKVNISTGSKQEYQGFTNGDIFVRNNVDAVGAAAVTVGTIDNSLNTSNKVTLAEGGHLETKRYNQDIILATSDTIKDTAEGIIDGGGAVTGSGSKVNSTLSRENRVDVNGDILSYNDAKLYAGMDKYGEESRLDFRALSHAYAYGAVSVAVPELDTDINIKNQVVTGKNSNVKAVRNINVEGNSGKNSIERAVQKYTWYSNDVSSDYVTTSNGTSNKNINSSDNYVDIQGNMSAGIYANQEIVIDGVVDLGMEDGKTNIFGEDVKSQPTITYGDGTKVEITTGKDNYANTLMTRYNEIIELLSSYSDTKSDAYQGYVAEKERILNTMLSLGLAEVVKYKDGTEVLTPISELDLQFIKISDLVASGGNITINSEKLKNVEEGIEAGRIDAKGNPQVSIKNNSNLYLKVGDIRILEKGGKISINDKVVKDNLTEETSAINILNTWNDSLQVKGENGEPLKDSEGNPIEMKVLSSIEITGDIENLIGDISIDNRGGDILMQGEKAGDSTNILAGGKVTLSATGAVSQAYSAGIKNVGTDPETAWKEAMEDAKEEVLKDNDLDEDQGPKDIHKETGILGDNTTSGIVAGGEIYFNAEVVDVNGKVQSGFDKYEVVLNGEDIGYNNQSIDDLIASYDKRWEENKSVINDNALKDYVLTEGKTEYNSETGTFYYKPATYYDPSSKEIVVENINVDGGKVYITGRVISTGNGKITALDGAANIKIDNNTDTALKVGAINNKDVEGLISINDIQKNTITEYYRDKTLTKSFTGEKDKNGNYIYNVKEEKADGGVRYYTPAEGMRYNWTEGTETGISKDYHQWREFWIWGALKEDIDEIIKNNTSEPIAPPQEVDKNGKPIGSFITQDTTNKNDFTMNFTNEVAKNENGEPKYTVGNKRQYKTYYDFLHFGGKIHYEWTEESKTHQSYTGSIRADRDIAIGFIGSENGNIDISSKNNIEISGDILNARGETGKAVTNITSENGSIIGTNGVITADTVNLSGKRGIENISVKGIESIVTLKGDAEDGNVNIIGINNILVDSIRGKDSVTLSAYGDISQKDKNITGVTGNRIDLISETGGIDLVVNSGDTLIGGDTLSASVNASGAGDISLKESEGDMRIGKIYTSQGDVTLETDGYIVDALPSGEDVGNSSTEEMITRWEKAGLIASEELTAKKEQQYNEYKNGVAEEYSYYQQLKEKTDLSENSVEAKQLVELEKKYGSYSSVDDYLLQSEEGQQQLELKNSGGKWDKNQLLYAIQDKIINPETGSTQTEKKDANIKGDSITLKAGKGVGTDRENTVLDLNNLQVEDLKKLASSNAGDVNWNKETGEVTIQEKNPIGIQMLSEEGRLNITATDNIYVAVRGETASETVGNGIYVENIATDGNIRLLGTNGVFDIRDGNNNSANFTGNDLILEGGKGDLGAVDNALTLNLKGSLTARAEGDIYLDQTTGDMNIDAIYSGGSVNLSSAENIFSVEGADVGSSAGGTSGSENEEEDENLVVGYINAGGGITLEAQGDIGTEENGVNIKNSQGGESKVDATGTNIYLHGRKEGELLLGNVTATEDVVIKSEDLIRTSETMTGKDITLNSENSITLGGGEEESTIISDNLNLIAKNGSITQGSLDSIVSNGVGADANSGISLDSTTNNFSSITLSNNTGDIQVNNSGAEGLAVTYDKDTNDGDIIINNLTGPMVVDGDISGTGNIVYNNNTGSITVNGNTTSGKDITVGTNTGDIIFKGDVVADGKGNVSIEESGDIEINNFTAKNNLDITTTGGSITSDGSIKSVNESLNVYSAKGDIDLNDVYAEDEVRAVAKDGNLHIFKANGNYIIVNVGNKDKDMNVENMEVGKGAIISSNDITVEDLSQREGEDSAVEITFNNSDGDTNSPISNVELHAKGLANGIHVNRLWVENADISTDGDIFQIPELVVTGIGHFSNGTTTTTVYGEDSIWDSSDIHIWNDALAKEWIALNFLGDNTIETTGVLLKVRDGFTVLKERESGEEIMMNEVVEDMNKLHLVDNIVKDVYKPYWNYNLIDNKVESTFKDVNVNILNNKIEIKVEKGENLAEKTSIVTLNYEEEDN